MSRFIALLLVLACFAHANDVSIKPMNLIVIMADDMGAKELGCYGSTEHQTPNLDRLAATGVQFDTAYSTPVCHPTRFMLMTGQYGHHNGVYNFDGRRGGPDEDAPEEQIINHYTFGKHLQANGYATALAGKWQLSGKIPDLIHETGFDEYRIWAYKHNLPESVNHAGAREKDDKSERYWNPCIVQNGEYMPTKPEDYGPDLYTDFLIDFMKRKKEEPFFIYYPMCLTHGPQYHTPDTIAGKDKNDGHNSERFKAAVEYTDKLVGRIIATLDELGLRDNTLVVFTADNATAGDGKAEPTELGARVPLIVNAPALIKTRGKTGELSDLTDIFPTLADFANAPLPIDKVFDGSSLHDFLVGKTDTHREWIYSYIADRRILRTKRFLLEDNSPLHYGHLFDCDESRDGSGYTEVTDSDAPEVLAIKEKFNVILEKHPAPILEKEGSPSEKKDAKKK